MAELSARHVVIFGRPGSGKSSLAERLGIDFGYTLIKTGELLRDAARRGDPLGEQVDSLLKAGQLVPDALVEQILIQALQPAAEHPLLFDGFPRTLGQVPILEKLELSFDFRIDCFLEIAVDRAVAERRMTGRRVCPVCGTTYHIVNQPPRVPETCDNDGARLQRRPDDDPETIRVRQEVYDAQTAPVVEHYRATSPDRVRSVDGNRPFDEVYTEACEALGQGPR